MHQKIASFTKTALKNIYQSSGADNLTCHLGNKISEQFWLFHSEGEFLLKEQLNGPLIHPKQNDRLRSLQPNSSKTSSFLVEFYDDPKNDELFSEEILYGQPFVVREKVSATFKLTIRTLGFDDFASVIFLNYREKLEPQAIKKIKFDLEAKISVLCPSLIELSTEPIVDRKVAMTFRGTLVKIIREFGENYYNNTKIWREKFLGGVISLMRRLIDEANLQENNEVKSGNTVICQIYSLERNGKLEVLAGNDNPNSDSQNRGHNGKEKDGIVEFVARTGDIFLVNDISGYSKDWKRRIREDYELIPKYQFCTETDSPGSELAIPIVLGDKVLGVLNLEHSERDAFSSKIVALAYYFSTVLALVLKEYLTWSDSHTVSSFSEKLLEHYHPEEVLKLLKDTTVDLKYKATVWNAIKNHPVEGYENSERGDEQIRTDPKNPGFTDWIVKHKRAVRLIDCHIGANGKIKCEKEFTAGPITARDFEFQKEKDATGIADIPNSENPAIREHIEGSRGVLCDVGIPICKDDICYGVLWAKMNRYSSTILQDEYWTLAHLCNLSGAAIARISSMTEDEYKSHPEFLSRERMLTFHFGNARAQSILSSNQSLPGILQAKWARDLIVMNVDIRGSSELMRRAAENEEATKIASFINDYHNYVSDIVTGDESRGILDKTMGDGIMAIFNGYREDAMRIDGDLKVSLESVMERSIESAFSIFDKFEAEWTDFRKNLNTGTTNDIVLGCGMVHDTSKNLLGSLDSSASVGHFDYSVYGPASNASGKLVNMARRDTIETFLTKMIENGRADDRKFVFETLEDRSEIKDLVPLYDKLRLSNRTSILLCSASFGNTIARRDGWNGVYISVNSRKDKDLSLFSDSIIWAFREN